MFRSPERSTADGEETLRYRWANTIKWEETMIGQAKMEMAQRNEPDAPDDEMMQENQRGGGGLLMQFLFPLIALMAIAFAGSELVR
jgi:hypothetical protein